MVTDNIYEYNTLYKVHMMRYDRLKKETSHFINLIGKFYKNPEYNGDIFMIIRESGVSHIRMKNTRYYWEVIDYYQL
tara:strand:- start:60 stop:290 length:231 start_codon:yes stop_codon:yes gene_type:complete